MALDATAVMLPGIGHVLYGTAGSAAKPALSALTTFAANTATLPTGFTELGHTDLSNVLTWNSTGGSTTVKGSWQNASLRQVVTTATTSFTINSIQTDNTVLNMFYGGGDITVANEFSVPDTTTPVNKAILIIMLDGTIPTALYVNTCSIVGSGTPTFGSDAFTLWPLEFTPLKNGSNPKMTWIADQLGA